MRGIEWLSNVHVLTSRGQTLLLVPDEGVSLLWEDPYFHYLTKR